MIDTVTKVFESWGGWAVEGSKMGDMRPRVPLMWSESCVLFCFHALRCLGLVEVDFAWLDGAYRSLFPGPASFPSLVHTGKLKLVKGTVVKMTQPPTSSSGSSPSSPPAPYILTINSPTKPEPLTITADIVIFGTGWRRGSFPFLSRSLVDELGLPFTYRVDMDSDSDPGEGDGKPERERGFAKLDDESLEALSRDQRTLRERPEVWNRPGYAAREAGKDNVAVDANENGKGGNVKEEVAPYRLYRMMVPTSHLEVRDVVVAGTSVILHSSSVTCVVDCVSIGVPTCKANHSLFLVQAHWYFFFLHPSAPYSLPSPKQDRGLLPLPPSYAASLPRTSEQGNKHARRLEQTTLRAW